MNCLAGCVSQYRCGTIKQAVPAEVVGPWVQLALTDGTKTVTVGNKSSPNANNTAVIKSFKIGMSSGSGVVVEIMDEEGTDFQAFLSKITRTISSGRSVQQNMVVTWGYTASGCSTDPSMTLYKSNPHWFPIQTITVNYEGGKLKYTIEGVTPLWYIFESRTEKINGSDIQKMPLKKAIIKMFAEATPAVTNVEFLRKNDGGPPTPWNFEGTDPDGPSSVWQHNQQNALATAMGWLSYFKTDRGKGIVPGWDSTNKTGHLIFWEDTKPACNETSNACGTRNLGTYIVNAGSCSPVISFQPSAQLYFGQVGKSGGMVSNMYAASTKMKGSQGCQNLPGTGNQTALASAPQATDGYGPKDSGPKSADAQAANQRANFKFHPINAELRIQGDPNLSSPIGPRGLIGAYISIVVINPFHLTSSCGDWTVQPNCNSYLSNRMWLIQGVDHDIREGSYVTTIKVFLASPSSEIDPSQPLGGLGSGGPMLPAS